MTFPPATKTGLVIVVDDKPLRRSMLAGFLVRLGYERTHEIANIDEARNSPLRDAETPSLVIISIGADRLDGDGPARSGVLDAQRAFADVPLVLISDLDTRAQVLAALSLGVKGFIHTEVSEVVLSLSLELVQSGGSVAPTRPFVDMADENGDADGGPPSAKKKHKAVQTGADLVSVCDLEELASIAEPAEVDARPHFSPRQLEVLRLIRSGAQNKHIAHHLNMREGTVKVHVRNIFRKLAVTNRTQAAFVIAQQSS